MREDNQASLTNDIQMGSLPMRQVKATEIVSANQEQRHTFQYIIRPGNWYHRTPFT